MSKSALSLALLAGTMFGTSAMAQMMSISGEFLDPTPIRLDERGNILSTGGYDSRAVGVTYGNYVFDTTASTTLLVTSNINTGIRHAVEDISFNPGPWNNADPHTITGIKICVRNVQNVPPLAGTQPAVRMRFMDRAVLNYAGQAGEGTSMLTAAPTVVATLNLGLPAVFPNNNFIQGFEYVLGTPVTIPAGDYAVELDIIDFATGTLLTTDSYRLCMGTQSQAATVGTVAGNPASPGSTIESTGNDKAYDGVFTGGAINGAANDHLRLGFNFGTPATYRNIAIDFAIVGDIPAVQPACTAVTLGASNAFASSAVTAGAAPQWYCVTLSQDAIDANNRYIDIDTEGSSIDTAIAVFDSTGTVIAQDDNDGSGTNAQLSFGMGRRAAVGDGEQYDGRNWNDTGAAAVLGLSAGTYWIAVVPSDAATPASFSSGFTAVAGGTGSGAATLRVRTNVADGVLEPSVAPVALRITTPNSDDPLIAPGGESADIPLAGPGVLWYDFRTCVDATAAEPVMIQGSSPDAAAFSMTVYDGAGNQIASGNGSSVTPVDINLTSNPAGTYYAAITYDQPPDYSTNPTTDGRWHVRGHNGSNGFGFSVAVFVSNVACAPACPGNECGPQDYNGDGDSGTDQDIEAFFACLGGNCCPTCFCQGSDFNGDGDFGTDQDIEAFFRVLGGNPC